MSTASFTAQDYLEHVHVAMGLGYWRELYLRLFKCTPFRNWESVVDLGAGTPEFLTLAPFKRRVAVDAGARHEAAFRNVGIELRVLDLENDSLGSLGKFDVAVCSDVFEHLLWPAKVLKKIPEVLRAEGVLISHVPNEYTLSLTLRIMAGLAPGMYFHRDQKEWNDPHIRRFTDIGYREFLGQEFKYNVRITHLKPGRTAGLMQKLRISPPLCLQGGPTYVSTNDEDTFRALTETVNSLRR